MVKFGTGGWRAIIGDEFIKSNIQLVCQSLAADLDETGIVIGYDRRFLSDAAAKWACEVFAANGKKVYFIKEASPTPLTMFAAKTLKTKYGMAITASHNPSDYNGIKIFTKGGQDATLDVTETIENRIPNISEIKTIDFEKGIAAGSIIPLDPFNEYVDTILGMIDVEAIKKKRLKVLIDPMFGVSKATLQTILMTARCDVDIINNRHDALFGGQMPSPAEKTLHKLKDMVIDGAFDIGIATDGDADRIGIIDDTGRFIHPNEIMALLYYYMLKYKNWNGAVVRNLATTHLLDKIAEGFGETCHEVPVGFKYISSKMNETDALIGGESSGGLTIRGHISGKDGIFASSLLVELISVTGKRLSELLDEIYGEFGNFHLAERDYKFSQEKKDAMYNTLFVEKKLPDFGFDIEKVSYEDGAKIYFKNGGWIIVRFSGTEPLLRLFAEMHEQDLADDIANIIEEFLGL